MTQDERPARHDADQRAVALVVGATGVVGRALASRLSVSSAWTTLCASRAPSASPGVTPVAVDLLDPAGCAAAFAGLPHVTHIFFAAYRAAETRAEEVGPNLRMLANTVEAVARNSPALQRVVLLTGAKFYGIQWGRTRTPMRETDPRDIAPNFYHAQEEYLRDAAGPWTWTNIIPPFVTGFATGSPMNLVTALAVFATVSRELGIPLRFPGSDGCFRALHQIADTDQIAAAAEWAAHAPGAANERFNVANGDPGRWENMWPGIAAQFGVVPGDVKTLPLAQAMPALATRWADLARKHGLANPDINHLVDWRWADYMFRMENDVVLETGKIRRAGFNDCIDSEATLFQRFRQLRENHIIP